MPTQQEVEYYRNKHQRMNWERFLAANAIALITHTVTQPLDLIKVRSQMLQEGKTFHGLAFQKGFHMTQIFNEIHQTGGMRKFYHGFDAFIMRTLTYTTARVGCFCYFYDWMNPDSRRIARPDSYVLAGVVGGAVAGILSNPFDIVFTRMQADALYPEQCRRNYSSFLDGFYRTMQEGALFRGAVCNGIKVGILCGCLTNVFDWCKENSYFYLGPHFLNRLWSTLIAAIIAGAATLPFDAVKTRLHIMRSLPDGQMPYKNAFDCVSKILFYEAQMSKSSNFGAFFAGGQAYIVRYLGIFYVSQFLLDYYHGANYQQEFWAPAKFTAPTGIDFDFHDPYTDFFYNAQMQEHKTEGVFMDNGIHHPHRQGGFKLV